MSVSIYSQVVRCDSGQPYIATLLETLHDFTEGCNITTYTPKHDRESGIGRTTTGGTSLYIRKGDLAVES